ncbi:cation/multidrug efflux pump, AcrB family [Psychroflexus torquis ATCC 700755]|uniref:Cation/multidrug efflux pump, AcrB family n=1 Tax=Psychroflexus torquis (strain ATCC 700755 / CIP 106069 / ACAM 623) TaxID=313595 RepID=K4IKQ9_PSYTT|nr:efflux RND transporter permease subunit [Psychroflexus torquis]AFU70388.1 cation/multidrug efflux pump, AcrB family [Psychroflexus torquis ATCC 700755]
MNIAKFSIKKSRITLMALGTIILFGISIYSSLSRDSMPPYTVRVANIITEFPGASPERLELLVTDKVEKISQELPELKDVKSTSRTGLSVVTVTLKEEVSPEELQTVWNSLRRKLDGMEGLPNNVAPFLDDDGIGDVYGIVVGLVSDGFSYAKMKPYVDAIKNDFIRLPDAAKVVLGGVQEERVFIEFDNTRLKSYGLSTIKLQQIVQNTNILSSGGEVNLGNERIILEPTGNFETISDIKNMLVPINDKGSLVKLGDITTISKGYIDPSEQRVRINGNDAISLHINLKENSNIIELGNEVNSIIQKWQDKLPVGLEIQRVSSLDTYIDDKVSGFVINLLQSIGIVLLVMLVFLGFRTGLIIASLIPIVTIMTLLIMGLMNIGLNQVTLAALIMALGMLVDNAIVVAETVIVKMEEGLSAKKAAIDACSELFTPLLISTLTTSIAFLAFYLSPTNMGDIVGPIFIIVSIALLSSWVVALSVITTFCYLFLKVIPKKERKQSSIDKVINNLKKQYKNIIIKSLHHKWKVVSVIGIAFILSLVGFTQIPFLFFPDSDRNMITVDVNLPEGTKIEATTAVVKELEQYMKDSLQVNNKRSNGILDWSSYIGQGPESYDLGYAQDEANSNYAHIMVNTSSFEFNKKMIAKLDAFGYDNFANADIRVKALAAGGGTVPIEIKLIGENSDELAKIAAAVKTRLSKISGTKNVKDNWGPKTKKFIVQIDQNRALKAGVNNQDIAISLQTNLDGFQTGEYREDDKSIPILMRNEVNKKQTLTSLKTLNIYSQTTGKSVPLLQVAAILPQWQYASIRRYNLDKSISITSELREGGNAATITTEIASWLASQKENWPTDYTYEFGGDEKETNENMGSVISYLPLSGFIIVLLLIIQFNSFRKMTMVVSTIPLALIGVVIGLLIFREPFGFMPFLGTISLAGIVINNAIVLIDRMEIEQKNLNRRVEDAIITACLQRFRPILLATFTTVLGLIPLYLSGGELWEGMAISIMIGLLFGTVITLVFIPTLYSILFKVNYKDYTFDDRLLDD